MLRRIIKTMFLIAMYELGKYLTNELIVKLQANDDIDTASISDHIHLNMEVSG